MQWSGILCLRIGLPENTLGDIKLNLARVWKWGHSYHATKLSNSLWVRVPTLGF